MLTGPAVAQALSSRYVSADDATLALCLTPVVVAVAASATALEAGDMAARLWPGLAGAAGLLLLLPQPSLSGWRFVVALLALPLLAGIGAVHVTVTTEAAQTPTAVRGVSWLGATLFVSSLLFALLGLIAYRQSGAVGVSALAVAADGLQALLTILALQRLGAVRWSSQFLIVPLLTMLEGAVLLRPMLDTRSWLAFVLLGVSSGYQIFSAP